MALCHDGALTADDGALMALYRGLWLSALICIAVAVMQFTSGAYAQKLSPAGKGGARDDAATVAKKKKAREIDEAYRATLKTIPAKPTADPWGGMR